MINFALTLKDLDIVLMSYIEDTLELILKYSGLEYEREFKFHEKRKWRTDFVLSHFKIAIECEGGIWRGGRHTRGSGFVKDVEKYNELSALGYRLLRFTPSDLKNPDRVLDIIVRAIQMETI